MLQHKYWLVVLLVTLGLAVSPSLPALASGVVPAVSPPTPGLVASQAKTNGDVVVWSEEVGGTTINADVFGARLSDGQVFTVASGPDNQINPKIDGSVVIWTVSRSDCPPCDELHARDLNGGDEFTVAAPGTSLTFTDIAGFWISGYWVVWSAGNTLMARNITTMADPVTVATAPDGWTIGPVAISDDQVVWVEQTANANRTYPWQIRRTILGYAGAPIVASGVSFLGGSVALAVSGDTLVYTVGGVTDPLYGQLIEVSLYSFASTTIADRAAYPTTDGRYIFWQTQTAIDRPPELRGYDTQSVSLFDLPATELSNGFPDLSNGALVWESSTRPDFMVGSAIDIETAWLWQVLPSGPRPDPGATSPDWVYFPETSHYLSFGFKSFWSLSGGLPVFGYPLTEEFSELNPDLGKMLTVQYLERQRFEYHPELAGTPYETSLGRLGAEDAAARNLVVTQPFQPLPAGTTSDANCQFFAVTDHRICSGFKTYWLTHGLDFGDAGVSYRESLALFGYPISEEFVDPETGLVTQYFERAVFEYHPNNSEPFTVLLKRLGANLMTNRGW